jgi:hypothetical protein
MRRVLLALLLPACSQADDARAPARTASALPADAYLVWVRPARQGKAEPPPPYTVLLDGDGAQVAKAAGIWIAADQKLWRIVRDQRTYALSDCTDRMGHPIRANGHDTVLTAIGDDGTRIPLLPADVAQPAQHDDRITSSAGSVIFVEASDDGDLCGAHGTREVQALALDLATGKEARLVDRADELAPQAAAALTRDDPERVDPDFEVSEIRVSWKDGTPSASYLLTTGADYATGANNGNWSAYAVGYWIDTRQAAFAPTLPAPVTAAVATLRDVGGVSVGHPTTSWSKIFP